MTSHQADQLKGEVAARDASLQREKYDAAKVGGGAVMGGGVQGTKPPLPAGHVTIAPAASHTPCHNRPACIIHPRQVERDCEALRSELNRVVAAAAAQEAAMGEQRAQISQLQGAIADADQAGGGCWELPERGAGAGEGMPPAAPPCPLLSLRCLPAAIQPNPASAPLLPSRACRRARSCSASSTARWGSGMRWGCRRAEWGV